MTLLRDADPRFRRLNAKVAVFVLLGLLASAGLLLLLAWEQGYFATKSEILLEAPTGTDLRPGMAVKLSGFKIGEVSRVELNGVARVDVRMLIEDKYLQWIKADSLVSVAREGLIGDSHLEIRSGNPALASLRGGDALMFEPTPALSDIAADLRARALPVIDGSIQLLDYLNDPQGDFRGTMAELRKLTTELRATRKGIDQLVADVDALARDDIKRTLRNADHTLLAFEQQMTAISERTDRSLTQFDATTASARQTAEAVSRAIETAVPKVNRLLDNTDAAVRDGRKLMDGAGKRWPFKGGKAPDDAVQVEAAPGAGP
ncbi:MAG: MlaD family protein [Pseudomonadota bacterium]